MRFLIIDTYYSVFLERHYARHSGLPARSYGEQWRSLMDACFGTSDFYSRNLKRLGHEAAEIVANCAPLQWKWAAEHGFPIPWKIGGKRLGPVYVPWPKRDWFARILVAQTRDFKPDVIHIQDPEGIADGVIDALRPYAAKITGQIASPYTARVNFRQYDSMLSSLPHFVERFRAMGVRSEYFKLGFEPALLDKLRKSELHDAVFVGGMSSAHGERVAFFEQLARKADFEWWGYGNETLAADSSLKKNWRGEAWALEMYDQLYNSRIAINHHINAAEDNANNMRLYEATGVGTLLLTDARRNLGEIFKPGREAAVYHSVEECAEMMKYYLEHEAERAAIAKAGQERTLREHTYYHRMQEYLDLVRKIF